MRRPRSTTARQTGETSSREYRAWINMRSRCNNPNTPYFNRYGGRGISVCPEWDSSYDAFLRDMGRRPSDGHSVDRIDVDKGYSADNCRWATRVQQCRNFENNRIVEVAGRRMTLAEAAEGSGLLYNTVLYRLKRGWSLDDALSLPHRRGIKP